LLDKLTEVFYRQSTHIPWAGMNLGWQVFLAFKFGCGRGLDVKPRVSRAAEVRSA
jgi:hypothetical protein